MLEIKFDVTRLNTEARQSLAAFILNWPEQIEHATLYNDAQIDTPFDREAPPLPDGATISPILEEPPSSGAELDSEGLPWDSRIHSSSRGKIANGSWKLMRGVDPARVEQVKNELRGVMAVPTPAPKSHYLIDQPGAVVPPTHTPPSGIRHNFVEFIEDITQRLVSKKLTQADILKACTDAGVASPNLLATRQDLIPQVAVALDLLCIQS
jgi:hypothetical protein